MKTIIMTALIASFIATSASAGDSAQQTTDAADNFVTTQDYLAQPNIEPNLGDIEPAAGGIATNSKNPLLERKFNNFKK